MSTQPSSRVQNSENNLTDQHYDKVQETPRNYLTSDVESTSDQPTTREEVDLPDLISRRTHRSPFKKLFERFFFLFFEKDFFIRQTVDSYEESKEYVNSFFENLSEERKESFNPYKKNIIERYFECLSLTNKISKIHDFVGNGVLLSGVVFAANWGVSWSDKIFSSGKPQTPYIIAPLVFVSSCIFLFFLILAFWIWLLRRHKPSSLLFNKWLAEFDDISVLKNYEASFNLSSYYLFLAPVGIIFITTFTPGFRENYSGLSLVFFDVLIASILLPQLSTITFMCIFIVFSRFLGNTWLFSGLLNPEKSAIKVFPDYFLIYEFIWIFECLTPKKDEYYLLVDVDIQSDIVISLSTIASCFETYLPRRLPVNNPYQRALLEKDYRQIANYYRSLQIWVYKPMIDTHIHLKERLLDDFAKILKGDYHSLTRLETPKIDAISTKEVILSRLNRITRLIGLVSLPFIFVLLITKLPLPIKISNEELSYLILGAFVLAALMLMNELDPKFSEKIGSLKDVQGLWKGRRNQ